MFSVESSVKSLKKKKKFKSKVKKVKNILYIFRFEIIIFRNIAKKLQI